MRVEVRAQQHRDHDRQPEPRGLVSSRGGGLPPTPPEDGRGEHADGKPHQGDRVDERGLVAPHQERQGAPQVPHHGGVDAIPVERGCVAPEEGQVLAPDRRSQHHGRQRHQHPTGKRRGRDGGPTSTHQHRDRYAGHPLGLDRGDHQREPADPVPAPDEGEIGTQHAGDKNEREGTLEERDPEGREANEPAGHGETFSPRPCARRSPKEQGQHPGQEEELDPRPHEEADIEWQDAQGNVRQHHVGRVVERVEPGLERLAAEDLPLHQGLGRRVVQVRSLALEHESPPGVEGRVVRALRASREQEHDEQDDPHAAEREVDHRRPGGDPVGADPEALTSGRVTGERWETWSRHEHATSESAPVEHCESLARACWIRPPTMRLLRGSR